MLNPQLDALAASPMFQTCSTPPDVRIAYDAQRGTRTDGVKGTSSHFHRAKRDGIESEV